MYLCKYCFKKYSPSVLDSKKLWKPKKGIKSENGLKFIDQEGGGQMKQTYPDPKPSPSYANSLLIIPIEFYQDDPENHKKGVTLFPKKVNCLSGSVAKRQAREKAHRKTRV